MIRATIIIIFSLTLLGCSYSWKRYETGNGKKIWIKQYKDYNVAEMKQEQWLFKYRYTAKSYEKYRGNIICDTTHNATFIQFDSIRVYLFGGTDAFKSIFTSGLVSAQMLYCTMDSSCKTVPPAFVMIDSQTGDTIEENLWGWTGHTITIDHFELLNNANSKPTQRRFKFWVYPYKTRFNGGNDIFFLELTNENANSETPLESFIQDARVTFIIRPWMMI